jgi:hypothetical protein
MDACQLQLLALQQQVKRQDVITKDHLSGTQPLTLSSSPMQLEDMKDLNKEFSALHTLGFSTIPHEKENPTDTYTPLDRFNSTFEAAYKEFIAARTAIAEIVVGLTPTISSSLKPPKLSLPTFSPRRMASIQVRLYGTCNRLQYVLTLRESTSTQRRRQKPSG